MAHSKKERLYWSAVVLYGLVLVGLLLYFRFPADKFRNYAERQIEKILPGISCSIGAISLGFPPVVRFADVGLLKEGSSEEILFSDPLVTVAPVWRNVTEEIVLNSTAYGGSHSARVRLLPEVAVIEVQDIQITGLNLKELPYLQEKLARDISGVLNGSGSARIDRDRLQLLQAEGNLSVNEGKIELKRPILELRSLDLNESSVDIRLQDKSIMISEGKLENAQIQAIFAGEVLLAQPWYGSEFSLQGELTPLAPLYQKNRQLKVIVSRMQERHGSEALPFNIGGTVGQPTFVFTR